MSGGPDEFKDIDEALDRARENIDERVYGHTGTGNAAEASVRALMPVLAIVLKDLRRLADAAERIAEAVEPPSPRSPRG